jgi:hypothetical protein
MPKTACAISLAIMMMTRIFHIASAFFLSR